MDNLLNRILDLHRQQPDRTAIIMQLAGQPDTPISYDQLFCGAAGVAELLQQQAIQPGEVVILVQQHGLPLVYSFFGAMLHGAIPAIMPFLTKKLSPEKYQADIRALMQVTQPAAILTETAFLALMQGLSGSQGAARAVIDVGDCPHIHTLPDLSQFGGTRRDAQDIVLLQHSSGTTGLQKGVALSHRR